MQRSEESLESNVKENARGAVHYAGGLRGKLAHTAVQVTMSLEPAGRTIVLHAHGSTRVDELLRAARDAVAVANPCERPVAQREAWPAICARLGGRRLLGDETLGELWVSEFRRAVGQRGGLAINCCVAVEGGMDIASAQVPCAPSPLPTSPETFH